jgi:hypothetical protein
LERELGVVLPRIVDAETDRVIPFGSAARGDIGSRSDLRTDGERALGLCRSVIELVARGVA